MKYPSVNIPKETTQRKEGKTKKRAGERGGKREKERKKGEEGREEEERKEGAFSLKNKSHHTYNVNP